MSHDFVFWGLMIGTVGAFGAMIFGLIFLFVKGKTRNRGEK